MRAVKIFVYGLLGAVAATAVFSIMLFTGFVKVDSDSADKVSPEETPYVQPTADDQGQDVSSPEQSTVTSNPEDLFSVVSMFLAGTKEESLEEKEVPLIGSDTWDISRKDDIVSTWGYWCVKVGGSLESCVNASVYQVEVDKVGSRGSLYTNGTNLGILYDIYNNTKFIELCGDKRDLGTEIKGEGVTEDEEGSCTIYYLDPLPGGSGN